MKYIDKLLNKKSKVLLIEDDRVLAANFMRQTSSFADLSHVETLDEAKAKVQFEKFDIVFIDLNLDNSKEKLENEGLSIISSVANTGAVAIVLSSVEDEAIKRKAIDLGAAHYFVKRKVSQDFEGHLKALILSSDRSRVNLFFKDIYKTTDFKIIDRFKILVKGGLNFEDHIILKGPTGSGKSLLARGINLFCGFADSDFVHLSVADFKEELFESELFGHKKGSFSGAETDKVGALEEHNGKTLFIDEIDLLPKSIQKKLLVFLSHGTFSRVGESKQRTSQIRLITATNQDIADLIAVGKFREDFYYRINKRELNVSGISERRGDIEVILNDLLKESSPEILLDEKAKRHLIHNYDYPGNVRELMAIVSHLKSIGGVIGVDNLPDRVFENGVRKIKKVRVPKTMKSYVEKSGSLNSLIEYIEEEITKDHLERNDYKPTPTRNELGISYVKMKNIMDRIKKRSNRNEVQHV